MGDPSPLRFGETEGVGFNEAGVGEAGVVVTVTSGLGNTFALVTSLLSPPRLGIRKYPTTNTIVTTAIAAKGSMNGSLLLLGASSVAVCLGGFGGDAVIVGIGGEAAWVGGGITKVSGADGEAALSGSNGGDKSEPSARQKLIVSSE